MGYIQNKHLLVFTKNARFVEIIYERLVVHLFLLEWSSRFILIFIYLFFVCVCVSFCLFVCVSGDWGAEILRLLFLRFLLFLVRGSMQSRKRLRFKHVKILR